MHLSFETTEIPAKFTVWYYTFFRYALNVFFFKFKILRLTACFSLPNTTETLQGFTLGFIIHRDLMKILCVGYDCGIHSVVNSSFQQ